MTPPHPFDNAIHLDTIDGNVRRGRTHPEWANQIGPFGGITAAVMLRAIETQPDRIGEPLALTVNFTAPIADGDFDISLRAARPNRANQKRPAVAEAAVIGIPHESLGEEVGAAVALKTGESVDPDELRDYVKARVAAYKYPRRIWLLDELPKGATGKVQKRDISPPTTPSSEKQVDPRPTPGSRETPKGAS